MRGSRWSKNFALNLRPARLCRRSCWSTDRMTGRSKAFPTTGQSDRRKGQDGRPHDLPKLLAAGNVDILDGRGVVIDPHTVESRKRTRRSASDRDRRLADFA